MGSAAFKPFGLARYAGLRQEKMQSGSFHFSLSQRRQKKNTTKVQFSVLFLEEAHQFFRLTEKRKDV
jgi:hypothetical protein